MSERKHDQELNPSGDQPAADADGEVSEDQLGAVVGGMAGAPLPSDTQVTGTYTISGRTYEVDKSDMSSLFGGSASPERPGND
jgi:hypothetical protein